ncbi:hypothetical protein AAHA92_07016 [Salvia divinorum]|uniref:Uncharacterized protein n=1 Tax=Salvia divinorum TaxID=28513 RepID=A0ABD1IA62_SALDI
MQNLIALMDKAMGIVNFLSTLHLWWTTLLELAIPKIRLVAASWAKFRTSLAVYLLNFLKSTDDQLLVEPVCTLLDLMVFARLVRWKNCCAVLVYFKVC